MTPQPRGIAMDGALLDRLRHSFAPLPRSIHRDLLRSGCVSLLGPPRAGKTTVAAEVIADWQTQGGLAGRLDLRAPLAAARAPTGTTSIDRGCRIGLLGALGEVDAWSLPEARFQSQLTERILRQPPRTLLVMDHCESLPEDVAHDLLRALRAALQEQAQQLGRGGISLLLISAGSIAGTTQGLTSPFVNMTVVHRLVDLDMASARTLLAESFAAWSIEASPAVSAWLADRLGGDRDLLQRAIARLSIGRDGRDHAVIDMAKAKAVVEDLLAEALAGRADWPLCAELLAGLKANRVLLDVLAALVAGVEPGLREMRRDLGLAEATGFVLESPTGYRLRTPFHEALARRLLTPRTLGDLAVLHGDWSLASGHYARDGLTESVGGGPVAHGELGLGLATCLSQPETINEVLRLLTEILRLCYRLDEVAVLTVRGRHPRDFLPVERLRDPSPALYRQIEQCVSLRRAQVSRVPAGQRWALPLTVRGADGFDAHWVLVFVNAADADGRGLQEARRLCLFAEQRLRSRLNADQDRAFAEITASIHEAEGLAATLQRVAEAAGRLTGADFSSIGYPAGDGLSTRAQWTDPSPERGLIEYKEVDQLDLLRGVTGYVHRTGRPLLIGHKDQEPDLFDGFEMLQGMVGAVAEAAVPIRLPTRALGVINVESKVPWAFAWRHVALLERLALLAGIAISEASRLDRAEHDAILGQVFGGIAHEANNHSAAIGLRAGLTQRQIDAGPCDPAKVRSALSVIRNHADAMRQLADDFRWLAQPDPERPAAAVSLQGIVAEAISQLPERLARSTEAHPQFSIADLVRTDLPEAPILFIRGRPRLLRRAIENLLQNACEAVIEQRDHRQQEPAVGDVSIHLAETDQGCARIEVRDRGPGLSCPADLFGRYYTTKGAKGLGLGLAIAKQVVEAHHGQIGADRRTDDTGACFWIEMPLCALDDVVENGTEEEQI